jgi:hypothetical protein
MTTPACLLVTRGSGTYALRVDAWGGDGGGTEGADPAPDESLERCTLMLDLIVQVRAARELRQRRGLEPHSAFD